MLSEGTRESEDLRLQDKCVSRYPATAAKLNGNAIEGVLVSTVQDGTFKSANICMAEIPKGKSKATFVNQTAVFRITPGAGADTKYVDVSTEGAEIANTTTTGYTKKNKIHVASASAAAGLCFNACPFRPQGL